MIKKIVFISIFVFLIIINIYAQDNEAERGRYTLKIAVIGPGDELYLWWGHIALIIEDSVTERNYLYDYGQFSFEQDNFFVNFAIGRLYYNCGVTLAERFLLINSMDNRDVIIYTLDVPQDKCLEIKSFAENNVLPENKYYEYHHFKDNCSTRIRDIIDMISDGQFFDKYKNEIGRFTLREHIRRHTWFSPESDWALNFWMGQDIDTPITVWEEMFLPSEVGNRIQEFFYVNSDGVMTKLVTNVEIFNTAQGRPVVLSDAKNYYLRNFLFSLILSIIFGFFFYLTAKNIKAGAVLAGISISFISLVFGFAAFLLYFMSIFTNHDYTFNNMNMIFASPILLVAFPFGLSYAFTKNREKRIKADMFIRLIWLLTLAGILISMFLKLFPWFFQDNLREQLLMLPIAVLFVFQPAGFKESFNTFLSMIKRR